MTGLKEPIVGGLPFEDNLNPIKRKYIRTFWVGSREGTSWGGGWSV